MYECFWKRFGTILYLLQLVTAEVEKVLSTEKKNITLEDENNMAQDTMQMQLDLEIPGSGGLFDEEGQEKSQWEEGGRKTGKMDAYVRNSEL